MTANFGREIERPATGTAALRAHVPSPSSPVNWLRLVPVVAALVGCTSAQTAQDQHGIFSTPAPSTNESRLKLTIEATSQSPNSLKLTPAEPDAEPSSSNMQGSQDAPKLQQLNSGHHAEASESIDPLAPHHLDAPANLDPADDFVVGPPDIIADCEARLGASNVTFKSAKVPIIKVNGNVCGAYQAVQYLKGPSDIRFDPPPVVSCPLALGLASFERLVQSLALEYFGQRVKRITQGGTYNCRSMARFKLVSEHSYANAIDLYEFVLEKGKRINVLRDFGSPKAAPKGKEGEFLRALARAAYDEQVFSVVVTRFFDELHRDHIHVDMAHYRTDGTR
jgi:hypothetical protein